MTLAQQRKNEEWPPRRACSQLGCHVGAILSLAVSLLWPAFAQAEPQASVGLVAGVAARGQHSQVFEEPAFHVGFHGDVLFGRSGTRDFGVGPYLEALSQAFDDVALGGGVSLLLPVLDTFPMVLSVGPYVRVADDDFDAQPGIASTLFFGSRSYDSDGYVMSFGLVAQARVGLDDRRQSSFVLALQVDTAFLASPIVYIVDAIDGGSREVDPVTPKAKLETARNPPTE
jgi:hypothetical protein